MDLRYEDCPNDDDDRVNGRWSPAETCLCIEYAVHDLRPDRMRGAESIKAAIVDCSTMVVDLVIGCCIEGIEVLG